MVYEYNLSERTNAAKAALAAKEKEEAEQKLRDRWSTIDTQLLILADKLQALEKSHAELQANSTVRRSYLCFCSLLDFTFLHNYL